MSHLRPPVNSRNVPPADHVCDPEVCDIFPDDCPECWPVPTVSTPPRPRPDHLVDMLGLDLSRLLREPVEDIWAMVSDRALPGVLYDVRRRPAAGVALGLLQLVADGPLGDTLSDKARDVIVDEVPGVLAAYGLIPEDDPSVVGCGGNER